MISAFEKFAHDLSQNLINILMAKQLYIKVMDVKRLIIFLKVKS